MHTKGLSSSGSKELLRKKRRQLGKKLDTEFYFYFSVKYGKYSSHNRVML